MAVTEFWLGYIAGLVSCILPFMIIAFFTVGGFADDKRGRDLIDHEEQPDIRLTTIKSEHVRSIDNVERY